MTSEIIARLPEMFREKKAKRYNRDIQLNITGEDGGLFRMTVKDQKLTIEEGSFETPNITVSLSDEDFEALFTGKTRAMNLVTNGRLKFDGGGMTEGIAFMSLWEIPKS